MQNAGRCGGVACSACAKPSAWQIRPPVFASCRTNIWDGMQWIDLRVGIIQYTTVHGAAMAPAKKSWYLWLWLEAAGLLALVAFLPPDSLVSAQCPSREFAMCVCIDLSSGRVRKVHFEVGVAMYGPFIFPENTQPISPILWLCLLEEDVELKKPFQVILPHYLTGLSKERIQNHQVGFAKANHSNFTFIDNQMTYKFQHCVIEPQILHASSGYRIMVS